MRIWKWVLVILVSLFVGVEHTAYGAELYRAGQKNPYLQRGYEISGGDMDFILTVDAESSWNPKSIGDSERAYGLCQWRKEWHSETINDPRFKD